MNCTRCNSPMTRPKQAKYCETCAPIAYRESKPTKEERRVDGPKRHWHGSGYLGFQPSEMDWARLAAFIDGEGCISFSPRRTNTGKSLTLCGRIVVANTNATLVEWLASTFGMKFFSKPVGNPLKWKPCYWGQACGYRACWVALNCLPWLMLKREQAELLLKHQETMGSFERGSGVKTPNNVIEIRAGLNKKMHELNRRGPKSEFSEKEESGASGEAVSA